MRGRLSFVFFILLVGAIPVILSLSFLPKPGEIDNTIPFIYYYENSRDALVIERADGTDSRILAASNFNAGMTNPWVNDVVWSPSGKWLAWRGNRWTGGNSPGFGWLASTNGKTQWQLNETYGLFDINRIEWSPVDDLLMVTGNSGGGYQRVFLMIIDPANGNIIAQADFGNHIDWIHYIGTGWFADGSGVYFEQPTFELHLVGKLTTNGETSFTLYSDSYRNLKAFSDGRILAPDFLNSASWDRTLVIEDMLTGKKVLFGKRDQYEYDTPYKYKVYWNDDLSRALIQECNDSRCEVSRLFMMDWSAETVTSLGEGTFLWNRPPGYSEQDVPVVWSRDGRYLVYISTDGHPAVYDTVVQTTKTLDEFDAVRWLWTGTSTAWIHTGEDKPIYRYEAASGQLRQVVDQAGEFETEVFVSPDERYLMEWRDRRPYDMYDLQTGTSISWIPHSATHQHNSGWIDALIWSSDSRWFFSAADLFSAGGGIAPDGWIIHNIDGTVRRELGTCFNCAGFVPERALKYLAEGSPVSVIPQPVMKLAHEAGVRGVAWSPDSTHIASVSGDYDIPFRLHIWDAGGNEPVMLKTYVTELECNLHPSPCSIRWSSDGQFVTLDNYEVMETWDIAAGVVETKASPRDWSHAAENIPVELTNAGWSGWSKDGQTPFVQDEKSNNLYMLQDNEIRTLQPDSYVTFADYRAGSPIILAGNPYFRIWLWDAQTGKRLHDMSQFAQDAALSPDGTQIAAAGSQMVTIWNVADVLE